MLGMINDLLDLARIEQGRVRARPADRTPADLLQRRVDRFAAHAEDSGVTLAGQVEPGLPAVMVDKERISHVFDNLVANALRHTGRGGRSLLGAAAADRVRSRSRIPVTAFRRNICRGSSTGSFACPDREPDPAEPAWAWRSPARSWSRTAARSSVESDFGTGTTFTFAYPIKSRDLIGNLATASSANEHTGRMSNGKTVLIVDDEPHVRLVFRISLESAGYAVSRRPMVMEALRPIHDAICRPGLAGPEMPRLDGLETLRRLRNRAPASRW